VTAPSIPPADPVASYVEDGARIAAILFVWTSLAAFFTFGVSELGGTGGLFAEFGPRIGAILALTGVLNALLYVLYRTVDYWHQH
jgi:hypothetical protein